MGLLGDYMSLPTDPNQNQSARAGLLQFGAALLGGKGNFGSILGQGLASGAGGYNSTLQAQQQAALVAAQKQRLDLDNQETQAKIDEPGQIASILGRGPAAMAMPTPPGAASSVRPLDTLPQIGASAPGTTPAQPSEAVARSPADDYLFYRSRGDMLSTAGRTAAAKVQYDLADKARARIKEIREVTVDGKRMLANFFEDGSHQVLQDVNPGMKELVFGTDGGNRIGQDAYTGEIKSKTKLTPTPGELLSATTQRRGQDMQHADSDPQASITDAAILNAAARYNFDGTLPPMGMGKNAAAGRSAILNKAAELKADIDPEQQRREQLNNKGDIASQSAGVKAFTSGKQGNAVRSFNVALSHLDTLGGLADALHNGDTQAFNKLGNAIASQTGKAAPTSFEAVKHIVGDEIVKAVTGSAGALGDREAAAKTIDAANSPAQLKAVMDNYRELMRGQLGGLKQQYETSTGRQDFDRFLSPQAKGAAHVPSVKDLPKKAAAAQAYADPDKERRYQEWKRSQGK